MEKETTPPMTAATTRPLKSATSSLSDSSWAMAQPPESGAKKVEENMAASAPRAVYRGTTTGLMTVASTGAMACRPMMDRAMVPMSRKPRWNSPPRPSLFPAIRSRAPMTKNTAMMIMMISFAFIP